MEVTTIQAIVAAVGLLGMGSLGGFILAWRRLPFERRLANATAAKDTSAAWQPLVVQLQEEIRRLHTQLDEQVQRIEYLEEHDVLASAHISELTGKLEVAERRITELEQRNERLENENARLRRIDGKP